MPFYIKSLFWVQMAFVEHAAAAETILVSSRVQFIALKILDFLKMT